jgi:hypothetical protein
MLFLETVLLFVTYVTCIFFSVSYVSTAQCVICVGYSAGKESTHFQAKEVYYCDCKISALDSVINWLTIVHIFTNSIAVETLQHYPPIHTCIFSASCFSMNLERVCHFIPTCYIFLHFRSSLLKCHKDRRKV